VGEVGFYLDTSVLVALLKPEPLSARADRFVSQHAVGLMVSDFTGAEFASAVSRWVRTRELDLDGGRAALDTFDGWIGRVQRVELMPVDVAAASLFLRRLDLPLRTPDAIHIAIAQRVGTALVTFDRQMAASARVLGTAVETP
jgi:predicted nucleic acid-binding protein